jgi:hypothetical protein
MRHSKTGKTWTRCLICHAARQRKVRRAKERVAEEMAEGEIAQLPPWAG